MTLSDRIKKVMNEVKIELDERKQEELRQERVAAEARARYVANCYELAKPWFEREFPALLKKAMLEGQHKLLIGTDSSGRCQEIAQRAQVCRDNGLEVWPDQHTRFSNEDEMYHDAGCSWYVKVPT